MKSRKVLFAMVLALVLCLSVSVAMATTYNVTDQASAQAALDQAKQNDVINLAAGNYGVLYIRQCKDLSTQVASDWAGSGPYTWHREINGLTIKGVSGTSVEQIVIEAHQYTDESQYSNPDKFPDRLQSYVTIKNFVIDGITFNINNKVALDFDGITSINGLTVQNCVVNGSGSGNTERLLYNAGADAEYKDKNGNLILTTGFDNVKLLNNTVSNVHQVLELRQAENIEISGNTFKNVSGRDILLTVGNSGASFTGNIVISNNTSDGSGDRFLRMSGVAGTVTIDSNTITNWKGTDDDVMKVDGVKSGATVTLSNCVVNNIKLQNSSSSGSTLTAPLPTIKAPTLVDANDNPYVNGSAVFSGTGNLVFKSTADIDTFVRAVVFHNGKAVAEVAAPALKNTDGTITVSEGSIKVTLNEAFLAKQEPGVYTITIEDNYSVGVSGTFLVAGTVAPVAPSTKAPQTGDNSNIALWISLMAISALSFVALGRKSRFN